MGTACRPPGLAASSIRVYSPGHGRIRVLGRWWRYQAVSGKFCAGGQMAGTLAELAAAIRKARGKV